MVTVSREYWLCFTQFRFGWMTGFMVRSNGVLLTFVYFYQLGETALSSALHFLTFTEVARFKINVETLLFACANFVINWLWYKCSLGLRSVPRSVKSKAYHSQLEETVSKRKKPNWNFINKGLQICSKMWAPDQWKVNKGKTQSPRRGPHFLKKKEKKRNIHFQVKGIFHRIRIFDWQTSPKHPNLWLVRFDPILYRDPQNDYLYKTQGHPGTIFCKITVRRSNIAKKFLKLEKS